MENDIFAEEIPDSQVAEMEDVIRKTQQLKDELDDDSVEVAKQVMKLVVLGHRMERKSERVVELIAESSS